MSRLFHLGRRPAPLPVSQSRRVDPDWVQAAPARIDAMLRRSQELPSGGWYAVLASRALRDAPVRVTLDGRSLVAWRGRDGEPRVAPSTCPHMGADLACGRVEAGVLVCPWHGLRLEGRHGGWAPLPAHDDGVIVWTRLPRAGEAPTDAPILAPRPTFARSLDAVVSVDAACEPRDVIANRLDPWHGVHYHPHSFSALRVTDETHDAITLRVSYRVLGPVCVEVDARFHTPDPRTVVMTIVDGEGAGSVVETHATPLGPGRTHVLEATLATSARRGFRAVVWLRDLVRPFVASRAKRLWIDDAAYAERTYSNRRGSLSIVPDAPDARRLRPRPIGDAE